MPQDSVGFALVGCGRIAERHAQLLAGGQVARARLVAVCDSAPERAELFGRKHGVPYFSDMHEMMRAAGSGIDVLSILTPSGMHAEHCLELVQYKKHFVVEKPMALRLEDANRMVEACKQAGVSLFVVKQNRLNLPVTKLREAMDAGRFGRLTLGTIRVRWSRTQAYYDQDSWRGTWKHDGGVFANQASHHVDLLNWMMGGVESVTCEMATQLARIEAEDTGVCVLRFKNGALGVIEATTTTRPKDLEGSISVLGEGGTVEIGGFAVNEMKVWNFAKALPEDAEVLRRYRENPPNVYGFSHSRYLEKVVGSLLSGEPPFVDGEEARKSLVLIHAIYRSAETGQRVLIDDGFEKIASQRLGR